jgi:hypothetical protein
VGVIRIVEVGVVEGVVVPPLVVVVVPVAVRRRVLVFVLVLVLILVLVVLKPAVVVGHAHPVVVVGRATVLSAILVGVGGLVRAVVRVGRRLRFLRARRRRRVGRLELRIAPRQPQQQPAHDEEETDRPSDLRMVVFSVRIHGCPLW